MIAHGFQNLRERHIVSLREQVAERVGLVGNGRRSGDVKRPTFAELQVRIGRRVVISHLILGGQRGIQFGQYGLRISKFFQTRTLQELSFVPVPTFLLDQIGIHGPVFVRLHNIQIAGFDCGCDVLE